MVGCGGEERKGILFVFLCTFPRVLCSWGFSFLLYWCLKQKKRMHCFWASGLLVQQQAYLYDTCNLNIQTNYQKENVDACFFFLHWILAVCNVYWIFKTVYLIFFTTLVTVVRFGKKRYFAFSTAFLTPWTTYTSLPATLLLVARRLQEFGAVRWSTLL